MTLSKERTKEAYERNAQIYKLMANAKRLEILDLLNDKGEMIVTEIVNAMGVRKANVSQHLTILRHLKLVKVRRAGKNAFYTITDPRIVEPCKILNQLWKDNPNLNL
jgi:ArsR family transcriptional regulator